MDIHYPFGVDFLLLVTNDEAHEIISATEVHQRRVVIHGISSIPMFLGLFEELCSKILLQATLTNDRMHFCLDDIDELVKLLIAVDKIGRDNISSLEVTWQSPADAECQWDQDPISDPYLMLPTVHVEDCLQLLKRCNRLA